MRNMLVRSIPDDLYEDLRERAKRNGRSLSAEVVDMLRRELATPRLTRQEIWERIQERRRKFGVLDRPAAELIREDRDHGHRF